MAALEESIEQSTSERLRDGPEGGCEIDLRRINVLIRSVRKRLPSLLSVIRGPDGGLLPRSDEL